MVVSRSPAPTVSEEPEVYHTPPMAVTWLSLAHSRMAPRTQTPQSSARHGENTQPSMLKVRQEGRLGINVLSVSYFPITRGLCLSDVKCAATYHRPDRPRNLCMHAKIFVTLAIICQIFSQNPLESKQYIMCKTVQ